MPRKDRLIRHQESPQRSYGAFLHITFGNRDLHNLSQFVSIVIHTRYGKKMLAIQGGIENERETNV